MTGRRPPRVPWRDWPESANRHKLRESGWQTSNSALWGPPTIERGPDGPAGGLVGWVLDGATGQPLPLTTVIATAIDSPIPSDTSEFTDWDGRYVLSALRPGHVYGDYKETRAFSIEVGKTVRQDVAIGVASLDPIVLDGARWVLEGVHGDTYGMLQKQSPMSPHGPDGRRFLDAAMWFIDAADLHVPKDEMY